MKWPPLRCRTVGPSPGATAPSRSSTPSTSHSASLAASTPDDKHPSPTRERFGTLAPPHLDDGLDETWTPARPDFSLPSFGYVPTVTLAHVSPPYTPSPQLERLRFRLAEVSLLRGPGEASGTGEAGGAEETDGRRSNSLKRRRDARAAPTGTEPRFDRPEGGRRTADKGIATEPSPAFGASEPSQASKTMPCDTGNQAAVHVPGLVCPPTGPATGRVNLGGVETAAVVAASATVPALSPAPTQSHPVAPTAVPAALTSVPPATGAAPIRPPPRSSSLRHAPLARVVPRGDPYTIPDTDKDTDKAAGVERAEPIEPTGGT